MKKYTSIVVLCTCVQLFAESNPFNLQDNLEKIDKDQDALLYELKKLSKKSKQIEIQSPRNIIESTIEQVPEAKQADNKENEKASIIKVHDKEIEAEKQGEKRLAEEEQLKKDLEKREDKKAKAELEKSEVEAYEAKRVEKEEKKRLKIKKDTAVVNINMDKEARIKKKNMDEEYLKAIAEVR